MLRTSSIMRYTVQTRTIRRSSSSAISLQDTNCSRPCDWRTIGCAGHLHYNLSVSFLRNIQTTLEMIKWEHSIFALPFALSAAMLAAGGWPTRWQLLWIVVCMVSARSAAMAFNRIADVHIDAANPRTKMRALPANLLSQSFVSVFILVSCALFVVGAA